MSVATYLRYSPEDDDIAEIRATFAKMRDFTFEKHRHALSDAHAKSHGILAGELRVHDDLPTELRQGLFAEPAPSR